ncbi:MAG: hypothetical protein AB7R89_28330 [Dehalococcoidia bacterium]
MADLGLAWCIADGPQRVLWEDRIGRDFRLRLECGHTRRALLVHHQGFRWVLPDVPEGYRVPAEVVGPDGVVE